MISVLDNLFHGLQVRPTTKRLVACLLADRPLPVPVLVDFGVDSPDHYRALRAVLFNSPDFGATEIEASEEAETREAWRQRIAELEQALGNGQRLNALVRKYAPEYSKRVSFQTDWDALA